MRVFLADDDARVCSALTMLLTSHAHCGVVGQSRNIAGLLDRVKTLEPDLVLLDWDPALERRSGILSGLRRLWFRPKIVALCGRPEWEREALDSGADAFVSKIDPPENLLAVLDRFLQQESTSRKGET